MNREESALGPDEFTKLIVNDYPRLVRALSLACGDRQVAEDSVQEALVRAWERIDRGEEMTSLIGWIAVVAMNESRSVFRRRRIESRARERLERLAVPGPLRLVGDTADVFADTARVRLAVLTLSVRQREVIVLHYFFDLGVASIADLLGITEGAVKNALFNARKHLVADLADPGVDSARTALSSEGAFDA